MKKTLAVTLILFFAMAIPSAVFATDAGDILGEWYTEGNKAIVTVYEEDGVYNGKITWLNNPYNDDGTEKKDINNPDPDLQDRTLIGMDIVFGFTFDGEEWTDGEIYNPENGKTYNCTITMTDSDTLKVRGSIKGFSLLGKTQWWTSAE